MLLSWYLAEPQKRKKGKKGDIWILIQGVEILQCQKLLALLASEEWAQGQKHKAEKKIQRAKTSWRKHSLLNRIRTYRPSKSLK